MLQDFLLVEGPKHHHHAILYSLDQCAHGSHSHLINAAHLHCAGIEQEMADVQQQCSSQAQDLTAAQAELVQLSETHQSLQQQLQIKVVNLQQAQDSLEDRARQLRRLQAESDEQAAQLTCLRAELQSSTQASAELQGHLADKTNVVSGIAENLTPSRRGSPYGWPETPAVYLVNDSWNLHN